MDAAELKKRYRWQCRRGLLEVDMILNEYLELAFDQDSTTHQQLFARLLHQQDADLFEWFTRRSRAADAELADYVEHILASRQRLH